MRSHVLAALVNVKAMRFSLVLVLALLVCAPLAQAQSKSPALTPKQIRVELGKSSSDELAQRILQAFGKGGLEKGKSKLEETTMAWAVLSKAPAKVVDTEGKLIGALKKVGSGELQVLALELPNFKELSWRLEAGGQKLNQGTTKIEHFDYMPDSLPQPGVPVGKLETFEWTSQIFSNTIRTVTVYIPAQYDGKKPACVMVWQDGSRHVDPKGQLRASVVFDNLIHKKEMPVTVGIFIDPGRKPTQTPKDKAANRGFEYDSLGDAYARLLLEEILPEVTKRYSLNLRTDPAGRAIGGGSSGGICSFTVAWERPNEFGKVLSWVGSFVDLRGGHVYPYLIRKTEKKPIRVYLLDGTNDLDNAFGNWPLANKMMASSLQYMGYDYRIDWTECFHGSKGMSAHLPDALRWLWRDVR